MTFRVVEDNIHELGHVFFMDFFHSAVLVEYFPNAAEGALEILLLSLISQEQEHVVEASKLLNVDVGRLRFETNEGRSICMLLG